jgi:modulator of FtsH protease HflK
MSLLSSLSSRPWFQRIFSLNDPQWGRGSGPAEPTKPDAKPPEDTKPPQRPNNNGAPPDFDKIMQDLNKTLGEIFGGKKGSQRPNNANNGGGGGEPGKPMEIPKGGIFFVLALAFLIWLATGFYIVNEGTRGVVLRFGQFLETTQPGPRWHFPYPIESREIVDIANVKSIEIGKRGGKDNKGSLMLTEDLNIVEATIEVQYTLKDAKDFLFNNVYSGQRPDEVVQQITETAIREAIGKRKMDALLSQGGRAEVVQAAQKLMQDILDRYKTGIAINKVNLQQINAPQQVIEAFNDVNKAEQDRDRLRNEGQAYANTVVPKAKGESAAAFEQASGYATAVVSKAEGDASRFSQLLTEYSKAPGVTRERLYIDMMTSVLGNTSKVFVDQKAGQNLLYLPMDKLLSGNNNSAPVETIKPAALPDVAAEPVRPRNSGDALRNREGR